MDVEVLREFGENIGKPNEVKYPVGSVVAMDPHLAEKLGVLGFVRPIPQKEEKPAPGDEELSGKGKKGGKS